MKRLLLLAFVAIIIVSCCDLQQTFSQKQLQAKIDTIKRISSNDRTLGKTHHGWPALSFRSLYLTIGSTKLTKLGKNAQAFIHFPGDIKASHVSQNYIYRFRLGVGMFLSSTHIYLYRSKVKFLPLYVGKIYYYLYFRGLHTNDAKKSHQIQCASNVVRMYSVYLW